MNQGSDIIDRIQYDLGWRKKEVSNLLLLENQGNQILIIKSTLLILYSHWEGFIKNACKVYLEHISNKKININDLTENFKAITLKGLIQEVYKSSETLTLSNELNFLQNFSGTKNKVFSVKKNFSKSEKDKSIINTKDNLNLNVFKSILRIIGIDYSNSIDTKSAFIDEKLLKNRNKVAHGNKIENIDEDFNLSLDELKELRDVVFYLMDRICEDVIYFIENNFYFESNKFSKENYLKETTRNIERTFKINK